MTQGFTFQQAKGLPSKSTTSWDAYHTAESRRGQFRGGLLCAIESSVTSWGLFWFGEGPAKLWPIGTLHALGGVSWGR